MPTWTTLLDKEQAVHLFTRTYAGLDSMQESRTLLTQKFGEAWAVAQQVWQSAQISP